MIRQYRVPTGARRYRPIFSSAMKVSPSPCARTASGRSARSSRFAGVAQAATALTLKSWLATKSATYPPRLLPTRATRPLRAGCARIRSTTARRSATRWATVVSARFPSLSPQPRKSKRQTANPAWLNSSPIWIYLSLSLELKRPCAATTQGQGRRPPSGRWRTAARCSPPTRIVKRSCGILPSLRILDCVFLETQNPPPAPSPPHRGYPGESPEGAFLSLVGGRGQR